MTLSKEEAIIVRNVLNYFIDDHYRAMEIVDCHPDNEVYMNNMRIIENLLDRFDDE